MREEITKQHPIFIKYRRQWLHQLTSYSFGLLSRVATGRMLPSRPFIDRCCYKLGESEEELFSFQDVQVSECEMLGGCSDRGLGQWLEDKCRQENLSTRQAAFRVGISHATIFDVIKGGHASPETIKKLSRAFATGGTNEYLALEDYLLVLAGYRTGRLQGQEPTQTMARLLDKLGELNKREVEIMTRFAEFLIQLREDLKPTENKKSPPSPSKERGDYTPKSYKSPVGSSCGQWWQFLLLL